MSPKDLSPPLTPWPPYCKNFFLQTYAYQKIQNNLKHKAGPNEYMYFASFLKFFQKNNYIYWLRTGGPQFTNQSVTNRFFLGLPLVTSDFYVTSTKHMTVSRYYQVHILATVFANMFYIY